MRRLWFALPVLLSSIAGACEDDVPCTANIVSFQIIVSSPEGLPIDRVTAERERVDDCTAVGAVTYSCHEQGGGDYTIRVYSGDLVWTRETTLDEDEDGCHLEQSQSTEIELKAATADGAQ